MTRPSQSWLACAVFLGLALVLAEITPPAHLNPYDGPMRVAARLLECHGDIPKSISWMEYFTHEGKRYLAYPPMASLLLVPYAALGGDALGQAVFNSGLILGTSFLLFRVFAAVPTLRPLGLVAAVLYVVGTPVLSSARVGSVWLLMHSEGNFFLTLALWLAVARRSFGWAGCAFMVAAQVRYAILMAGPVFAILALLQTGSWRLGGRSILRFAIGCLPSGLLVLGYNFAFFGDPFFSSYLATWAQWGQPPMRFSTDYVWRNLVFYTTAMPVWTEAWPHLVFPSGGQTIFVMSPFFLGALVPRWQSALVRAAVPGVLLMFAFYLSYSFQGSTQFGSRYMQDLYPLLFPVALSAFGRPASLWRWLLGAGAAVGVFVNVFGTLTAIP